MALRAVEIRLSEFQKELLTQEVNRHQISDQLRVRIQIILKASEGISTNALTKAFAPGNHRIVKKWRDRWAAKQEGLQELEELLQGQRGMKKRLLEAMLSILRDAEGRGRSSCFTTAQEELIITMACKKPSEYGLADNEWTQGLLAKVAVREGIVARISQSKVCTILKKRTTTP